MKNEYLIQDKITFIKINDKGKYENYLIIDTEDLKKLLEIPCTWTGYNNGRSKNGMRVRGIINGKTLSLTRVIAGLNKSDKRLVKFRTDNRLDFRKVNFIIDGKPLVPGTEVTPVPTTAPFQKEQRYKDDINFISNLIKESNSVVVLTGAGISTESGLNDFRGKNGMWKNKNPFTLASIKAMNADRKDFIEFYANRINEVRNHNCNRGHIILSQWQSMNLIETVITQNVDMYHQEANLMHLNLNSEVIELHGNIRTVRCTNCGKISSSFNYSNNKYECDSCGGFLRPNVVLMGENVPQEPYVKAMKKISKADTLLVIGTSLKVSPALDLVIDAYKQGTKIIIINKESTSLDFLATKIINEKLIGDVLEDLHQEVTQSK